MTYKKILLGLIMTSMSLTAMAVPAKRGFREITQSDGSVIRLELMGDERCHTYLTIDGYAVSQKEDGLFYYVTEQGVSDMRAFDPAQRGGKEKSFITTTPAILTAETFVKNRTGISGSALRSKSPSMKIGAGSEFSQGRKRIPVILVQFQDVKFSSNNPKSIFENYFNGSGVSGRKYFIDQSNGKFEPDFDLYGPYTLSGNRSVYGGNTVDGDDKGVGKMVAEACKGLNTQIDFSQYDNSGDGECEVVIVLYAGVGEASSDVASSVWPCSWYLSSSDYGKAETLDGKIIDQFGVFNELYGGQSSSGEIDGIGVFCHEFSHCLGLPDFYPTNYSSYFGMGSWSLMDYGCYNDDGYTPVGYTAYEKNFMGWLDIEEGAENTRYTLPVFNSGNISTDKAVKLTNERDKNEYYIIENRAKQGWDKYLPAEGLLIYHVAYNVTAWEYNQVNNYSNQRMTPVPADNSLVSTGQSFYTDQKGDLWPYNGKDALTDSSTPAAKVYTGSYLGKPVTEMTRNGDGTISFWVMKAKAPQVTKPVMSDHELLSSTSFTAKWVHVTDTEVSYTLEVREGDGASAGLVSSTVFNNEDHGWKTSGYTKLEEGGIRLGSNNQPGGLTSPAFEAGADGKVSVVVNSKYYGIDSSSIRVGITDANNVSISSKDVELSDSYKDYTVVLNCTPETMVKVKIETTGKKKRLFVAKADIYNGEVSASSPAARAGSTADVRVFEGIKENHFTVTGLKENGIYTYRVKAVPSDSENFTESGWSASKKVDLSGNSQSGITEIPASEEDAMFFNLQGVKVDGNLTPGIYIMKQGNRTSKIMVR